jgi:uncharacterized BrkB/YihY/UPF0761 family membrane protein
VGNPLAAVGALFRDAARNWIHDHAQSMGAALACCTIFSIAPLLLIVIAVAGAVFGEQAPRGEIYAQLRGMLGDHGALAVQDLLESARRPADKVPAAAFGLAVLIVAGKFVIGLYIGRSGITSAFGAAASLIVVLLWVCYSAQVFLFGAEFTWVWSHRYGSRRALARSS